MDPVEDVKRSLLMLLRIYCSKNVKFSSSIQVKVNISFVVDSGSEIRVQAEDTFQAETFRENILETWELPRTCFQSNTEQVTSLSSATRTPGHVNEINGKKSVASNVDEESASDVTVKKEGGLEIAITNGNDKEADEITHVIPSSPPSNTEDKRSLKENASQCPLCPSNFQSKIAVEKHLRQEHDIGNMYICTFCDEICPSNAAFLRHMQKKHRVNLDTAADDKNLTTVKRKSKGRKPVPEKVIADSLKRVSPREKKNQTVKTNSFAKQVGDDFKEKTSKRRSEKDPFSSSKARTRASKSTLKLNARQETAHNSTVCPNCGKEYKSKRALRRHIANIHELKRWQCDMCGKCFTSKESLYHHKRGIHGNEKPYKCAECNATFNFNHSLKLHLLKHSGTRPYACNLCGKTYLTSNHLKIHMQALHGERKGFFCKDCGKQFSYLTSLRMHEMSHGDRRPFQCSVCNKGFVNSQALKYHTESKHASGESYKCDICFKTYKTKFLMKAHRRRHTEDGTRYMCDICGRQFMYKSTLDVHTAVHNEEKSFTCNECGKSFKTYATLYSHKYVHKTETPYTCSACGKSFKTKERCKAHERRHSGAKPYKCLTCGRCFPDKGGLSKHQRSVHTEVKKFVCDICGKACSRADNLRVHMKIHSKSGSETITNLINQKDDTVENVIGHSKTFSQRSFCNTGKVKPEQGISAVHKNELHNPSSSSHPVDGTSASCTPLMHLMVGDAHSLMQQKHHSQSLLTSLSTMDISLLQQNKLHNLSSNIPSVKVVPTGSPNTLLPIHVPNTNGNSNTTAINIQEGNTLPVSTQPYMYTWPYFYQTDGQQPDQSGFYHQ
ncbi:hypothetical protein CHS0354_041321 [Potamilus streckersoni]|uniref:C2H2-type domain-containing protein n=1 Tax=Potamilus streckersoni TaxID=2493646 RepID=A0AAE0SE96_9BIVA|nr:hypothetical protein CHS0354_041321 [Potamilus streckersoni]